MAMHFLGEALPDVLKQRDHTLNILGATSGDTGSAAEYAFRSKPNIGVFMLSPKGRMSKFQRAQMYTLTDDNVHFNVIVDRKSNRLNSIHVDISYAVFCLNIY